jgi:outer membrane receptor for ferrienterochelin and colicins
MMLSACQVRSLTFIPLLALVLAPALAQEAIPDFTNSIGVSVTDGGNRVVYAPDYFTPYNVVTARDQLERIPGLQEVFNHDGEDERGFGNAGAQILINGKRLSGKSNDIGSAMDRIQARQVICIEVIRGTVSGLDVRSQGRVVNIVLDGTLVTGVGSWQLYAEDYSDSSWGGGSEVSYNGDIGALSYLFSANGGTRKNLEDRNELFFTPANALIEQQLETGRERTQDYGFTTNTSYSFLNGHVLNLNGRYAWEDQNTHENSERQRPVGGQLALNNTLFTDANELSTEWEIGGDFAHTLRNGNVLTTLFVYTHETGDDSAAFSATPASGTTLLRERQTEVGEASEAIVRGTYQWGFTDTGSIQSGAEFALNTVDQTVRLLEHNGTALQEVALFNPDSSVEETRFEVFSTYTWQARPSLLVEGSVDLEFSEISQQGRDVSRSRNFFFARPRLVVRYDLTQRNQLRGRFERRVDQLDFDDFISSFSGDDNRIGVISAGNPELEPEQAWEYELTWEYQLPDDLGVFSVRGMYGDIRNSISSVPLLIRNNSGIAEVRTATGNIDNARTYELDLNGSLRLAWLGWRTAIIEASVGLQDTSIRDPFTGNERDFNGAQPWNWSLGFRHDTSWQKFSYGFTVLQDGPSEQYDIDFGQRVQWSPELELFMELQPVSNLTVNLSIEQALRPTYFRQRLQYVEQRSLGVLQRREERDFRFGREITLTIQGVF